MSERISTALVYSDDPKMIERVRTALGQGYRVLQATTVKDAVFRCENEEVHVILHRTQRSDFGQSGGLFQWALRNKKMCQVPWIILGSDLESSELTAPHKHVKQLKNEWQDVDLQNMLSGVFFGKGDVVRSLIDVRFVNPIVNTVVEVLKTMAQVELRMGTPSVRKVGEKGTSQGDISGIIAVTSNSFSGALAITYQKSLILKIFSTMMSEPKAEIDEEVQDAVMELTNIIFGNARRDLNLQGHSISPAIPSVITGSPHEIRHSSKGFRLCIPFASDFGEAFLEVLVAPQGQ
jgi:chemotaxis protein CheX